MAEIIRVAVDGPSGAGKSTVAKAIAKKMNYDYIDTGAMYRAIGYKMMREGIETDNLSALEDMLKRTEIDFVGGDIILDGIVVNDEIRTPEMSMQASACSAIPMVRGKLVEIQRQMGHRKSVIMDGRDIGTNVLTDAQYKFFLTASAEERAERRYKELLEKGQDVSFENILADIKERDYNDSTRDLNPLKKAEDAVEVDSTDMTIEEVIDFICKELIK